MSQYDIFTESLTLPPEEVHTILIDKQPCIPKEHYYKLFGLTNTYDFPSLLTDDTGLFTCDTIEYDKFDKFTIIDGKPIFANIQLPDTDIEQFILSNKIKQIKIALLKTKAKIFETHDSYIYPEIVKTNSAVYDTFYLTDFLLKHIYRILMAFIIHNCDEEYLKENTYLIGKPVDDLVKFSNIEYQYGFLMIIEYINRFIDINNLGEKQQEFKSEYLKFTQSSTTSVMSATITYKTIKYKEEDGNYEFSHLKPDVRIECENRETQEKKEIPSYAKYLIKFFDEYYDDIKKAFPIYNRLENIFRLCAINVMLDHFDAEIEMPETIYVDTYARSISLCGSGEVIPTYFVDIKMPKIPSIPYKHLPVDPVVNVKVARRALSALPMMSGAVAHSALIVETRSGGKQLIEYMGDGQVYVSDAPNSDQKEWTIQKVGETIPELYSVEDVRDIMKMHTESKQYNIYSHNCHLAQQRTRQTLGLEIKNSYKPL
jgi:hypothetical protein